MCSTTCRRRMNVETKLCENPSCMAQHNGDGQLGYDLAVDVSDCSGTLNTCRLLSTALETMIGYSVSCVFLDLMNFANKKRYVHYYGL